MRYLLGVDIGTSSAKSLLMREDGSPVGTAQRMYDIHKEKEQYAEQDMVQLWEAAADTIAELSGRFPEEMRKVAGIGFSGQMHGLVMTGEDDRPVRRAIIWADQRSQSSIDEIYRIIPRETYQSVSLNALSTGFLVSSLVWVRDHEPENFRKTRRVMLPKDYIRFRMTGEYGTDYSDASSTAIFDTVREDWAWDLIDRLGFERELFVPCHGASDLAGTVTKECAKRTGLPAGTPVVYGGGDTIVQAVGNGLSGAGTLISNIGTASQLLLVADRALHDPKYRTNTFCYAEEKKWLLMGANISGGIALKWFRGSMMPDASYENLTEEALTAKAGCDGLLFLPYLSGERTPWNDPQAKGIFWGLDLRTTRADMIRAVMEGIIYSQRASLEIFRAMGIEYSQVIASGGGARGSLFRQLMADMFEAEVRTSLVKEQGCTGAAMLAGIGAGVYRNMREAAEQVVHLSDSVTEPIRENTEYYTERYQLFRRLYPANRELFRANRDFQTGSNN
jgi:xylulokinase